MKITDGKIILRAPELRDVDVIYRQENTFGELWESTTCAPVSRMMIERYVREYSADINENGTLRLMIENVSTESVVGSIDIYDYNHRDRRGYVAIFVDIPHRRKGYGEMALKLLCDYAERVLGLHQLAAEIATENQPSRNLFEKTGFKSCGRLRSWLRKGRRYYDVIIYQKLFFN